VRRVVVDHLTRIIVDSEGARASALVGALSTRGFTVRMTRGRLIADSNTVEAAEAKGQLRALGFADREYRVHVEYARQWGFL
jgi:hypothetical protein